MLSSVANRMYWVGRYLERAENTARLVNVYTNLLLDLPHEAELSWPQLLKIVGCEASFRRIPPWPIERAVVKFLAAAPDNVSSIAASLAGARENIRTLRDIVPREAFESVNELYLFGSRRLTRTVARRGRHAILTEVIKRCQQITGLFAGTMSHGDPYEFLRLGRNLERADMTTRIVDVAAAMSTSNPKAYAEYETLLWINVLQSLSAYQAYRQSARSRITPLRVVHFVMHDASFPRSFSHCLAELEKSCQSLPRNEAPLAAIRAAKSALESIGVRDLAGVNLHQHTDRFQRNLEEVHETIASTWFTPHTTTIDPAAPVG